MSKTAIRTGIASILILILAVGTFFALARQILVSQSELTDHVAMLAKHRAQQSTFFEMKRTAEETAEQRSALESLFFSQGSDSVDFLNLVEGLAPEFRVSVETVSLSELLDTETNYQWLAMTFNVTGGEQEVESFIQVLERLPYALRLTRVSMEERSSTLTAATVDLQVRLLQYET